jgi:hypothetical protein
MKNFRLAIAALFAITNTAATGAEITIACPTELPREALMIATPPGGWQPFISSPLYLHSAGPIFGPPERLGQIRGRTTKRSKGESTVQYDGLDSPPPEGVWFSCEYGEGNEFTLAKTLPAGITSCVVKYKKGQKAGQNDLDIRCK